MRIPHLRPQHDQFQRNRPAGSLATGLKMPGRARLGNRSAACSFELQRDRALDHGLEAREFGEMYRERGLPVRDQEFVLQEELRSVRPACDRGPGRAFVLLAAGLIVVVPAAGGQGQGGQSDRRESFHGISPSRGLPSTRSRSILSSRALRASSSSLTRADVPPL